MEPRTEGYQQTNQLVYDKDDTTHINSYPANVENRVSRPQAAHLLRSWSSNPTGGMDICLL
jgi:hypothetical protein